MLKPDIHKGDMFTATLRKTARSVNTFGEERAGLVEGPHKCVGFHTGITHHKHRRILVVKSEHCNYDLIDWTVAKCPNVSR